MSDRPRPPASFVAGSLFGFVVLGLPDGMLGVAWPALRQTFHQPLDALGELLLSSLASYLITTSLTGWALRRWRPTTLLVASGVIASVGTGLFVSAPWWGTLVVGALLMGSAGGGLDATLNTVVALSGRFRFMNLLHAAYGVGAAFGPLVVTAFLVSSFSWRGAYGVLFAFELALVVVWVALGRVLSEVPRSAKVRNRLHAAAPNGARPAGRRTVLLSLLVYFIYTGLEVSVASWSASFLRGPGGLSTTIAGVAVFVYWISLALGRIAAASLGPRLSALKAVRLGILTAVFGGALLWANLTGTTAVVALVVLGLGLGPIFPALVSLTPLRLGSTAALDAVGWQLAAAGAGGSGLSAAVGVLLQHQGLIALGATLLSLAVLLGAVNLVLERWARL